MEDSLLNTISKIENSNNDLDKIKLVVQFLRVNDDHTEALKQLTAELRTNTKFCIQLIGSLQKIVSVCELTTSFTDNGIIAEANFYGELKRKLKHKLLPELKNDRSLDYILSIIFYKKDDYEWINDIDEEHWVNFLFALNIKPQVSNRHLIKELLNSLQIISYRIAALSLEKGIKKRFDINAEKKVAFIKQQIKVNELILLIEQQKTVEEIQSKANEVIVLFDECIDFINEIKGLKKINGTSVYQTFLLIRIEQQIDRAKLIIDFADGDNSINLKKLLQFFKQSVENENKQHKIRPLVSETISYLAFQVVEHEGKTGEHYITSTRKEYTESFKAAAGGGLIISFTAVIKNLFHFISAAPFWQSFLYGLNYAIGFVVIYSLHWTIATKQPAMTASALASALDEKNNHKESPKKLAELVAKVSRSQISSFAGNLIVVFPLSYLIAWGFDLLFGFKLADEKTSMHLIHSQNPFETGAWFYAGIAGVFLFLSGIITGYFDNVVIYNNIKKRIEKHPLLINTISESRLKKWGEYVENNLGGLMGNITLGFFLGFAIFFGTIFGVPFDIRHVTISSANFGIGIYGLNNNLTSEQWITTTIGLLGIGFINFITSFTLALFVALKSRRIKLRNSGEYLFATLRLFTKKPLSFFIPQKDKA